MSSRSAARPPGRQSLAPAAAQLRPVGGAGVGAETERRRRAKRRVDPETGEEIDEGAERRRLATAFVEGYGALHGSEGTHAAGTAAAGASDDELAVSYRRLAVAERDVAKVRSERPSVWSSGPHPSRRTGSPPCPDPATPDLSSRGPGVALAAPSGERARSV
eukprot:SAG11_NODE_8878_length_967_cov_1.713134_1_plen_162_part_00